MAGRQKAGWGADRRTGEQKGRRGVADGPASKKAGGGAADGRGADIRTEEQKKRTGEHTDKKSERYTAAVRRHPDRAGQIFMQNVHGRGSECNCINYKYRDSGGGKKDRRKKYRQRGKGRQRCQSWQTPARRWQRRAPAGRAISSKKHRTQVVPSGNSLPACSEISPPA